MIHVNDCRICGHIEKDELIHGGYCKACANGIPDSLLEATVESGLYKVATAGDAFLFKSATIEPASRNIHPSYVTLHSVVAEGGMSHVKIDLRMRDIVWCTNYGTRKEVKK